MWTISNALLNSLSSRVPAADSSAPDASASGPSVPLNSIPTAEMYWLPDRTTAPSPRSRSGMTCEPLTEDHGEAVLTLYRVDFPVRISHLQDRERVFKENSPDSGWRWPGSSLKWNPATSSWKTRQLSLLGDSEPSSVTWPKWGTMRTGECWEQTMWVPLTDANESGSLPTPTATPYGSNQGGAAGRTGKVRYSLDSMARLGMWPTPRAQSKNGGGGGLDGGQGARKMLRNNGTPELINAGSLNPNWVEWLMGWPTGWTDLRPSATVRSHSAWPWPSSTYTDGKTGNTSPN